MIRQYQGSKARTSRIALRLLHRAIQLASACDIPLECRYLGRGLLLPHRGLGVVIHPETVMGINCAIFHGTTLGMNWDGKAPILGDCVEVGPGAKILGGVKIGDYAQIGAGAIVTKDVPAYSLCVGYNKVAHNERRFPR